MNESSEYQSIVAICLMASFADGAKNDQEREKLVEVLNGLGLANVNLSAVYHNVLLKKFTLEQAVAGLQTPEMKQLAYEMAVTMCNADGISVEAERAFLKQLSGMLQLPETASEKVVEQADAAAAVALPPPPPPPPPPAAAPAGTSATTAGDTALDGMITRYAVLTGALELMPQSLASLAILPLQVKMVYRIGRHFGITLDAGHIKEFIATIGVGMAGQMLDGMARKFFGKMAGKMAGKLVGGVTRSATSAGVTFATTWAIGQVARQYYASGRRFDTGQLRGLFESLKGQGTQLYERYAPDVQRQAGNLDLKQVMSGKLDAP